MSSSKLHLIERAAEELLRTGSAPDLSAPPPADLNGTNGAAHPIGQQLHTGPVWQPALAPILLATMSAAGLLENGSGRRKVSEEFRLVQNQLVRAAFPAEGSEAGFSNLLMVTSARPREGKTFTALNLAAGIARQGDRPVLLLDADAKRGSLSDVLGIADGPGLLDLTVSPGEDPAALLRTTEIGKLSVMPVGQQGSERSDMLASEQMVRTLQMLGRRYPDRLIVIDVSPCLSASDPAGLAPYIGQTVFVIEAERTQREEVEAALDLIQACPSITLLLNKVRMSTPRSFGAYAYAYNS